MKPLDTGDGANKNILEEGEINLSMDMVAVSTLVPISQKTNTSFDLNNSMAFGIKCYEAGMIHVLKGIAEEFLDRAEIYNSDFTRRMLTRLEKQRIELEKALRPEDYKLVRKYEEFINDADSSDAADHYVQGFLDGYRYLSNRNAYKSEGYFKRENKSEENE